jgi:hypothetical protein
MRADDVATIESADVHLAPPPTHGAARASPQADPRGSQLAGAILVLPLTEHLASTRGAQRAREGGKRSAASSPREAASPRTQGEGMSSPCPPPPRRPSPRPPSHHLGTRAHCRPSARIVSSALCSPAPARAGVSRAWGWLRRPPLPRPTQTRTPAPAGARPPCAPRHTDCRIVLVGGGRVANGCDASLGRHRSVGWGNWLGQGRPLSNPPLAPLAVAHLRLRCSPRPLFANLWLNLARLQ